MNKIKFISKVFGIAFLLYKAVPAFSIDQVKTEETAHEFEDMLFSGLDREVLEKRLVRMSSAFKFKLTPEIEKLIHLYAVNHRKGSEEMLGRASIYFPLIEKVIAEKGLPKELKYIPVIESAMKPYAISPAGASGLWQFMRSTGIMMGLNINQVIDERYDPIKSTYAALNYLSYLYDMFGDWTVAIAAYNCGPGTVKKAMAISNSKDYWVMRPYLPAETRRYVPRFIATSYILHHFVEHNLNPVMDIIAENPTTARVYDHVRFSTIAKTLDIDMITLKKMNPAYLKGYIPSSETGYHLTLPEAKLYAFATEFGTLLDIVYQPVESIEDPDLKLEEIEIPFSRELIEIAILHPGPFSHLTPSDNTQKGGNPSSKDNLPANEEKTEKPMVYDRMRFVTVRYEKQEDASLHFQSIAPMIDVIQLLKW